MGVHGGFCRCIGGDDLACGLLHVQQRPVVWRRGITIIAAIAVNILFRSWQTLLVIGLFTTQERMIHPPQEFADQVSRYRHQRQSRTSSS